MNSALRLLPLLSLAMAPLASAAVFLNELDSSTVQVSSQREGFQFIELKGTPGESLDGKVLVFYNGADDRAYRTVDLSGYAIPADGLLVVGNPGVPNVDLILPLVSATGNPQSPPADDTFQPGPDAVALYQGAAPTAFVDAGLARKVDSPPPGAVLVDAVVYASALPPPVGIDTTDPELTAALLLPGSPQVNEGGTNRRLERSIGRTGGAPVARNTTSYRIMSPTPGEENVGNGAVVPAGAEAIFGNHFFVEIDDADLTVAENAGPVTARVKHCNDAGALTPAPAGGITVTLTNTDVSEFTIPASVFIPAGATSAEFVITPVDDAWADGAQIGFIQASAAGIGGHSCWLHVTDNDAAPAVLSISEVQGHVFAGAAPFPAGADTNGDGTVNAADQFVEIVNISAVNQDLSGMSLLVGDTVRHVFPPCTVLCPGEALIVAAGGVTDGITAAFGGSAAFNATTGSLTIPDGVAQVRLVSGALEVLGFTAYSLEGGSHVRKGLLTAAPDNRLGHTGTTLTGADPVTRSLAAPALWASAGLKFDGTAFTTPDPALLLTTCVSAAELKGANAGTLTITRAPGDSNRETSVLVTLHQTAAGGSLDSLQVQDGQALPDDPTTCSDDTMAFADDPDISELPAPYPAAADARTYCVRIPAGTASKVLTLFTRPDANVVDEVFTFSALSSCHLNTAAATPAALTVIERGTLLPSVVPDPVFADAGNGGATVNLNVALGGRPAPAFPITVNDLRSDTAGVTFSAPSATLLNVAPNGTVPLNVNAAITENTTVCLTAIAACDSSSAVPETFNGEATFTLTKQVAINEIAAGANSFIELVNNSGQDIDLNGWSLAVNGTVVHTFSTCSALSPLAPSASVSPVLPPRKAVVVFENSTGVTPGITAANGTALVEVAGVPFGLAAGSVVTLRNAASTVYFQSTYQALAGSDARLPDGSGIGFTAAAPTPGTRNDGGGNFSTVADSLTLAFPVPCIAELAGANATTLTVSRTGSTALDAQVCLVNSNPAAFTLTGESGGRLTVTIPAGSASTAVTVTPTDTTAGNGDRTGIISAISAKSNGGYLNPAPASLLVKDSGTMGLALRATSIVENAGPNASLLTLTRPASAAACSFTLTTSGDGGAELRAPIPLSFPGGVTELTIPIDALNDPAVTGPRVVNFLAIADAACECLNGSVSLTVIDDGGVVEAAYLNEIDYSQPGADSSEFVELFLPGATAKSLAGYTLAIIDGATNLPSSTFDLTGQTTDAAGFFVLGESVSDTGRLSPPGGIDLPDTASAVALYRGAPDPANLSNNLVDAIVYGGANATLQAALTPGTPLPLEAFVSETPGLNGPCTIARFKAGGEGALLPADLRTAATWQGLATTNRTPGHPNAATTSGFDAWAELFPGIGSATDDADGDSIPNLVEYALGTDPTVLSAEPLPTYDAVGDVLSLTIPLGPDAECDPHLSIAPEFSLDLITWTPMTEKVGMPGTFEANPGVPGAFTRIRVTFVE